MTISITCPCGKKLRAPVKLAGKQAKCPACGQSLSIPALSEAASGASPDANLTPLAPLDEPSTNTPTDPLASAGLPAQDTGAGLNPIDGLAPQNFPPTTQYQQGFPGQQAIGGPYGFPSQQSPPSKKSFAWIWIAGGAGAVVLFLAVVFVVALVLFEGDSPTNTSTGNPQATYRPPKIPAGFDPPQPAEGSPQFSDGVAAPPDWLVAVAPFDVREFFRAPPPNQNAAPLYLGALFEFNEHMASCFPPEEQQRQSVAKERRRRLDLLWEKWSKAPDDPAVVSQAELESLLKEFETGFEKLVQAQQHPCVFQTGISILASLPHAQAAQTAARAAALRAGQGRRRGDLDEGLEMARLVLRLSWDLRVRASMVPQIVSGALDRICCDYIIMPLLAQPTLTVAHCNTLLQLVAEHQQQAADCWETGLRGEYVVKRFSVFGIQYQTAGFDQQSLQKSFGDLNDGAPVSLGGILAHFEDKDENVGRQYDAQLQNVTAEHFQQANQEIDRQFKQLLSMGGQPFSQQKPRLTSLARSVSDHPNVIVRLMKWSVLVLTASSFVEGETRVNAIQGWIMLRRYELQHKRPAADLATAARAAGADTIPQDVFAGAPLKMAVVGGERVIYSIGPDGRDDAARRVANTKSAEGDLLFRLRPWTAPR